MNKNSVAASAVVHSAALSNAVSRKSFEEGSSVFIRVLKSNGNNSYTVSFGGNRFVIKSEVPLQEGQSFSATIKLGSDKILLIRQPVPENGAVAMKISAGMFDSDGKLKNPLLVSYFEKLGLIPDHTSFVLLEQMKQLGMKFSHAVFNKARILGGKFKENKSAAARTALVLEQKGICASEGEVHRIMDCVGDGEEPDGGMPGGSRNEDDGIFLSAEESGVLLGNDLAVLFKKFFEELLDGRSGGKNGVLALFNHSGFCTENISFTGSWIKVPFELSFEDDGRKRIRGAVCFFLNPKINNLEKCTFRFLSGAQEYTGVMFFRNNKCIRIRTSINLPLKIDGIEIESCGFQYVSDFDCGEDSFFMTDGFI